MSKSVELRQKRSELWEKAKLFLDNAKRNGDVLSIDDRVTYEKMEQEIVDLGKEIGIIERREALDLEMSKPTSAPISTNPNTKTEEKPAAAQMNTKNHSGGQCGTRRIRMRR